MYALAGIRFYGIGNEYMGVLIGGALLLAASVRTDTPAAGVGIGLWFGLVAFVLSFPAYGAKAGGAITAVTIFVIAWRRLRGLPMRWTHSAAGLAAGFLIVFTWALAGHWLPIRRTHIDTAVGALGHGRFGYIAGVALRKVGLAVRVTLHPGTLLGLLGLGNHSGGGAAVFASPCEGIFDSTSSVRRCLGGRIVGLFAVHRFQ